MPQNFRETDVDCGGLQCAPCASGRACQYDSDCDQNGTTTAGTSYAAGTTMVVCAASTTAVCTDLRAGAQAYGGGLPIPGFVAFNLTVSALGPAAFTATAEQGIEAAIASSLAGLSLPLVVAQDILVLGVRACLLYGGRQRVCKPRHTRSPLCSLQDPRQDPRYCLYASSCRVLRATRLPPSLQW